ncbi:MAG: hypothetical protein Tsb005_14430 [Gammaproteobacteria bacterium]
MSSFKELLINISSDVKLKNAVAQVSDASQLEQVAKDFGYHVTSAEVKSFLTSMPNVVNQDSLVYGRDWCYPGSGLDEASE